MDVDFPHAHYFGFVIHQLQYLESNMQLSQSNLEISNEQVITRDIAELYLRIQENTQFLTNIIRHQVGMHRPEFNLEVQSVELKSFFNLIVQSSYLLYTCSIRKVSVLFSKSIYLLPCKDSPAEIIQEFLLEEEWLNLPEGRRKSVQQDFQLINPWKHENSYAENVLRIIRSCVDTLRAHMKKHKDKKVLNDRVFIRQLEGIEIAINLLSPALEKRLKSKVLISCLEETEVFRVNSYLLKTLNCSIYEAIRKSGKFKETLQEIKKKEILLSQRFNMMLQENLMEYEVLQNLMEDFFKYLLKSNIIDIEVSVNSNSEESSGKEKSINNKIGHLEVTKYERIYSWKIRVQEKKFRELTYGVLQELSEGEVSAKSSEESVNRHNVFLIEYIAKRGLISVKYVSEVEVTIENSDTLMYHCNNMMMEWNSVSVEQLQKQSGKHSKRKEKEMIFKVMSPMNLKSNPFINILLFIDMAMIYGKVSEPQIARKIIKMEDYSPFTLAGKRISHLTNLFIKKIKRLYENTCMDS